MIDCGWNRENPAIGYDHRIPTASIFQPFSGVFLPEPARTLSSGIE
jgi:hypothetical protein